MLASYFALRLVRRKRCRVSLREERRRLRAEVVDAIKVALKSRGMTQRALAMQIYRGHHAAAAASTLSMVFAGAMPLPTNAVEKIEIATGIPRDRLLVLTHSKPNGRARGSSHALDGVTPDELLKAHAAVVALGRTRVSYRELRDIIALCRETVGKERPGGT